MYNVNPNTVAIDMGILTIKWYSLAYFFGLMTGWRFLRTNVGKVIADDLLLHCTIGIVLGGRFGYILFYNFTYYVLNPFNVLKLWEGGMSFHGGLIGAVLAAWFVARKHSIDPWKVLDKIAVVTPVGIALGRGANFMNGELYGKETDVDWSVVFNSVDNIGRHPSQLYEAVFEGLVPLSIFILLERHCRITNHKRLASGLFCSLYGIARICVEFWREPDAHIGYIMKYATLGQILTVPILLYGLYLTYGSLVFIRHEIRGRRSGGASPSKSSSKPAAKYTAKATKKKA